MELVALKTLSNGIKAGQTFTESNVKTAELLLAIGAARACEDKPGVFVAEESTSIFAPPSRRRRRSRRTETTA